MNELQAGKKAAEGNRGGRGEWMEGEERKWGLFGQSGEFGTRDLQCKVQREGEQEDIVNRSRGEHLQSE